MHIYIYIYILIVCICRSCSVWMRTGQRYTIIRVGNDAKAAGELYMCVYIYIYREREI